MIVGSFLDKPHIYDWLVEKRRDSIDRRMRRHLKAEYERGSSDIIINAIKRLEEYFNEERRVFMIPVVFTNTEFQGASGPG